MKNHRRSTLICVLAAGLAWSLPGAAQEAWPNKPVRLVVPFAPGGSTDVVARMMAQKLTELWGQTVVVDNRAGVGGNLGADIVAKSPADGYTLLFASGSITINPQLYKRMPFDTRKDLVPITNVASGPMLVVVPFAPGGSTDVIARMMAQKLTELWGQTSVVDNRAGAGGNLGADIVAKSPADGYTLLFGTGSITINPQLYKKMPFDSRKDLVPITNVKELIAAAKAKPGTINFGSAGVGSQVHLAGENFANAAGIDIVHVPYKGEAPAYTDLIAHQTQMMVGNFAAASALLGKGRLRALAVTGKQRSPLMPELPTVAESGLPGFENTGWFGLLAPAGTPPAILAKVHADSAKVLAGTDTKARLYVQGMTPVGNTPSDFAKAMDAESVYWATVVKNRKLTAN